MQVNTQYYNIKILLQQQVLFIIQRRIIRRVRYFFIFPFPFKRNIVQLLFFLYKKGHKNKAVNLKSIDSHIYLKAKFFFNLIISQYQHRISISQNFRITASIIIKDLQIKRKNSTNMNRYIEHLIIIINQNMHQINNHFAKWDVAKLQTMTYTYIVDCFCCNESMCRLLCQLLCTLKIYNQRSGIEFMPLLLNHFYPVKTNKGIIYRFHFSICSLPGNGNPGNNM